MTATPFADTAPMFVVLGSLRSGTTLLAQCLNAHPDLVVPDETDFLVPAAFVIDRVEDETLGKRLIGDLMTGSVRFAPSLGRYLSADRVRQLVDHAPYRLDAIVSSVYDALAATAGAELAGDKSPNDIQFLRVLLDEGFFDRGIKALHIVRDVRDVVVSMQRLGWSPDWQPGYARYWSADNIFAAFRLNAEPGRYHRLRYEDLVADPDTILKGVCEFLGVPFDPTMTDLEARIQASHHADLPHHERTFQEIDASAVGIHEGVLDEEILEKIHRHGAEGLRFFGYRG